ncbi:NAD(P)/FAD-dependent oxidoreductase [Nocardioides sp.]|uniref:NAD(P)/FAD-dependent oxidoreductase n=1 Tax=Nocardioides sp. TaxID=35761 RepID=UPI003527BF1B
MTDSRIAVVGGSLGGLRAAEQLRRAGHAGPITVYGAEPHPAYTRPPLSKELLADPDVLDAEALAGRVELRRRSTVGDVDFRWGSRVVEADPAAGRLTWRSADAGSATRAAGFDGLVAATGLRPRRLPLPGPQRGRVALRTVDDCAELRALLAGGPARVVVIGAGFVGVETATTLRGLGHHTTVVEPAGPPMSRVIGDGPGRAIQAWHEGAGVEFVIGRGVEGVAGTERVTGVVLDDGTLLHADVVVEAVGSLPNVEWLAGAGLDLTDGVLCRNDLSVPGADAMVAVGDVARFPNPLFDDVPRRVEHWSMPADTARRAAATLVARLSDAAPDPTPFAPVPSFWSDQGQLRLQSSGMPALGVPRVDEGDPSDPLGGVLVSYHRDGRQVGTLAVNLSAARQRELRDAAVHLPSTA